ncbi:MAG: hypothetical protein J0M02_10230, partial [Planctomycetes bacterium]|nr:hypothetical protein [Planctomycetota bacterium]
MHWLERLDPRPHAAGSVRQRWPWRDARRTLHDHELLLFGRGYHGRIVWDGGHATISGDGWIIIPPGLPHTCDGGGTGSPWRAWIHFDWDASAGADPQQLMTYAPAAAPPQALRPAPAWVAAELPAQGSPRPVQSDAGQVGAHPLCRGEGRERYAFQHGAAQGIPVGGLEPVEQGHGAAAVVGRIGRDLGGLCGHLGHRHLRALRRVDERAAQEGVHPDARGRRVAQGGGPLQGAQGHLLKELLRGGARGCAPGEVRDKLRASRHEQRLQRGA